jgi:hypothetical protein
MTEESIAERVRQLGIDAVAAQFFDVSGSNDNKRFWIVEAITWGEGLDDDTHLKLVLATLQHARDEKDLWLLGDGAIEEGLRPRPAWMLGSWQSSIGISACSGSGG